MDLTLLWIPATLAGAAAETAPAQRALKAKAAKRTARRANMRGQLRGRSSVDGSARPDPIG